MRTSNSAIQTFKQCRRMYQLKYIYGFEPVEVSGAIDRGLSYHEGIEHILCGNGLGADVSDPKVRAMVWAFGVYIVPKLAHMCVKVNGVERWFEFDTESGHAVVGRMDGVTTGGSVIEHKTTSGLVDGAYWQKLDFDEQIPTYMLARGTEKIYYTVCATPSIRQKKAETDSEFFARCCEWFAEDTEQKINILELRKSKEELNEFSCELDAIISEMEKTKLFYRNPGNCNKWGRMCEYAPICKNCDPNGDYIGFKRRESAYEKAGAAKA